MADRKDFKAVYKKIIGDLVLIEGDLYKARNEIVEDFLLTGKQINPDDAFSLLNMVHTRLTKIKIVSELCDAYSIKEYKDRIITHELELIYNKPMSQGTSSLPPSPISGERL